MSFSLSVCSFVNQQGVLENVSESCQAVMSSQGNEQQPRGVQSLEGLL